MEGKRFRNTYRIATTRLPEHDYGAPGWYFITICTKNRICWFGDVIDGDMILSDAGRIVADEWQRTARMRPNVRLDAWVVMPNHIHMLFEIVEMTDNGHTMYDANAMFDVETHCNASLPHAGQTSRMNKHTYTDIPYKNEFGPQQNNVASIIRGFKGICTNRIKTETNMKHFLWQSRFYDRIVRDERGIYTVRKYIHDNPKKWWQDKQNPFSIHA